MSGEPDGLLGGFGMFNRKHTRCIPGSTENLSRTVSTFLGMPHSGLSQFRTGGQKRGTAGPDDPPGGSVEPSGPAGAVDSYYRCRTDIVRQWQRQPPPTASRP